MKYNVESKKDDTNELTYKTDTDSQILKTNYGYQRGKVGGRDREFGIDRYTLLYLKWITSKDILYSTGNPAQCYVAAWTGGESAGEWMHVYV